ncbi:MAG: tetraacyldisaccharide 4'-kinase [Bacteroidales bacterium]|nr:tetraacyldisaccharide 4'-kinase [Bacteroidales bacterium]
MNRKNFFIRILLFPLSLLYGIGVSVRYALFSANILSTKEFDIPVISVGNITVGGTGKTPHIEYLVSILKQEFGVATLSRGYKRKTKGFKIAEKNSSVYDIGDEPKQIKQKFPDISVSVCAKRVKGINNLLEKDKENNLQVILLDDAFQHRYVKPGLSILLIDYNRPITKDSLLPLGNLRESPHQMRRANIIIVTKTPSTLKPIERRIMEKELNIFPYQTMYFTSLKYGNPVSVFKPKNKFLLLDESFSVLLFTGISTPKPLVEYLEAQCSNLVHIRFSDHHNFTKKDLLKIKSSFDAIADENKIIITTEKDAMRLQDLKFKEIIENLPVFFIPLEIDFILKDKEQFNKQILNYVRTNKRNSKLHT